MSIVERAKNGMFSLVAEIGVNYYDIAVKKNMTPIQAAIEMVREAKDAGVHAVKFQTYKAETLAAKKSPSYWDTSEEPTRSQYELFKKFDSFGYNEYNRLSEYCRSIGIEFFSTAFDYESAEYLNELMGVYKISSSDLNNHPFIEYMAKKNKPILLSTGASDQDEIEQSISVIRKHNNSPLVLMHCVLEYPTPYKDTNLNKIISLAKTFPDCMVGYSDHTRPVRSAEVIAVAHCLGALVVEKHFTLDKTLSGNDHYHAMDPGDAKAILDAVAFADEIRGSGELVCLDTERTARKNARRSLVTKEFIPKGTTLTEEMLTAKRPGTGIPPNQLQSVLGSKTAVDLDEDTILEEQHFR